MSLAYPVLTGGATIESINIIHNTNTSEGDLYLMGDCGGNPDTNNILWAGCACIQGTVGGAVTNYCLGELNVDLPATSWVVAVFRDDFAFDIAFDDGDHGPGHTFGSLVATGNCGDWDDLNDFGFGGCSWVSLVVAGSPGVPECCDSPALCDGDVNGDGLVDPLDSGFILARFGLDASDPANCQADANCDGLIDPLDSGYVLARFGLCNEPIECPIGGGVPGECGGDGGPDCGAASCLPPASDCCEIHTDPGCDSVCGSPDDGGVEACVCNVDDFCCETTWDQACVDIVELFSCADCSDNNPDCAECVSDDDCSVPGNECIGSTCTCVETAPVNDDCADVAAVDLPVFSGSSIELSGSTNCAATTVCDALGADSVWNAFTIDSDSDVSITWCGSPVTHSPQYFVIDTDCPCTGDFIFADTNAFGLCVGEADNMTADYLGLTAGTYYVPSYAADDSTGLGEDYTITVSIP